MPAPDAPVGDAPGRPARVLTGGQTGADRAALDAALAVGIPVGGWCPAGRWAEDGPLAEIYPLVETASSDPAERTRRNVEDADAVLVLAPLPVAGGTALALAHARALGLPVRIVDPFAPNATSSVVGFGAGATVNVVGPRESEAPGVYAATRRVLGAAWAST